MTPEPPWRKLLDSRVEKKWDSFSWTTLRALVSSLNDRINAGTPGLVGDIRAAWIDRVGSPQIIDRKKDTSFIVLGDPGEQDASQFVVAPALQSVVEKEGPSFMVICSDVIYPSGDVNDYVDGFYVPYDGVSVDTFALPGNHDWYDGLMGFMWHFCQEPPLATTVYGGPEHGSVVEWVFRLLWRRPSKPRPQLGLGACRDDRFPNGPLQRTPYFAIDTKHVRVVCIDTGITGEVDAQQAQWLLSVSADADADADAETPARPKLLLTGKPLLVDREWRRGHLAEPVSNGGTTFTTVDSIVRHPEHGYVAAIGGDIHNFQRYAIQTKAEPFHYFVSGGGGAYMSATHPLAVVGGQAPQPEVLYPDEVHSLRHFARKLLPRLFRGVRALGLVLLGLGLAALWLRLRDDSEATIDALTWGAIGLGVWGVVRSALPAKARATGAFRFFVCVAALATGAVLGLSGWWLAPEQFGENLAVWTGLAAGGAAIAVLVRVTHWWRRHADGFSVHPAWAVLTLLVLGIVTVLAWTEGMALGIAATATTIIAIATTALRARGWWSPGAAFVVAMLVQFADALVILQHFAVPEGAQHAVWAAVLAVLGAAALVALVACVVLPLLVLPFAALWPGSTRAAWGRLGGPAQAVLPVLAGGALAAVAWWLHGLLDRDIWRVAMVAGLLPLALIGMAFLTDWTRRHSRWSFSLVDALGIAAAVWVLHRADALGDWKVAAAAAAGAFVVLGLLRRLLQAASYKLDLLVLAGAGLGLLWSYGAHDTWVPHAAAAGAVVLVLTLLGVSIAHLVFIGAPTMLVDPRTWGDRQQFTTDEAKAVLAWRTGGSPPQQLRVRLRANIVFPGADRPHGPLQEKVSEVFDADDPPFAKHFLVVDSSAEHLHIWTVPVTGDTPEPAPFGVSIQL